MLGTAGSTTDPLQDTAEPIGEVGGVSGKTYFRKGRRHQTEREGWGVCGMKSEKQQKEHQGQRRKTRSKHKNDLFQHAGRQAGVVEGRSG